MAQHFLPMMASVQCPSYLNLWSEMQDQKPDTFLQIMKCAAIFGMPKLLACCEYRIALSCLETSHVALTSLCASDLLLAHSWTRIAKGLGMAIEGLSGSGTMGLTHCSCQCCGIQIQKYGRGTCQCTEKVLTVVTVDTVRKLVPSPKMVLPDGRS